MILRAFCIVFCFAFIPFFADAQQGSLDKGDLEGSSFKSRYEAANQLLLEKHYLQALELLLTLVEEDPDNANINSKIGFCYLQLPEKEKALPYLEKIGDNVVKNYDAFSHTNKKAPLDSYYYLGRALHIDYQFDKAKEAFNNFLEVTKKKHFLTKSAERYIQMCGYAKHEMANRKPYEIENIGGNINSKADDYSPVATLDDQAMYFTSKRVRRDSSNNEIFSKQDGKHYEDIYVSYKDAAGNWGAPKLMDFSSLYTNEAVISVTADGLRLFVYQDINGDGNIFFSDAYDTSYTDLEKFAPDTDINTKAWETHLAMSVAGNTLYFVSDREGGLGGRDIYRCARLPDGTWSKAQNLGPPINTEEDEDAPFLAADGTTLYFSSQGHASMGGFDIFVSKMTRDELGNEKWQEPENMGYPLNTVHDDVFYTVSADGLTGYYSSNKAGGFGEEDIYIIKSKKTVVESMTVLKGFIRTTSGEKIPASTELLVTDLTLGTDPLSYRPRVRDGGFVLTLKPCNEYLVEYMVDEKIFHETTLEIPCESGYQEISKELLLDPINIEQSKEIKSETISADQVKKEEERKALEEEAEKVELKGPRWQVLYSNRPYEHVGKTRLVNEKGEVISTEVINKFGQFKYSKLDDDEMLLFELELENQEACENIEIVLLGEKGEILKRTFIKKGSECKFIYEEKPSGTANYQQNFSYNKNDIELDEENFKEFVRQCMEIIKVKGTIDVSIESSASHVPTDSFNSNQELADRRSQEAKERLIYALKQRGVDADKIETFSIKSKVQGPKYKNDARQKRTEYEKYQYVKIFVN